VEAPNADANPVYEAAAYRHVDILRLCFDRWPKLLDMPGVGDAGLDE
jgi:hypothetical protein